MRSVAAELVGMDGVKELRGASCEGRLRDGLRLALGEEAAREMLGVPAGWELANTGVGFVAPAEVAPADN